MKPVLGRRSPEAADTREAHGVGPVDTYSVEWSLVKSALVARSQVH